MRQPSRATLAVISGSNPNRSSSIAIDWITSNLMLPVGGIAMAIFLGWTAAGRILDDEIGAQGRGIERVVAGAAGEVGPLDAAKRVGAVPG